MRFKNTYAAVLFVYLLCNFTVASAAIVVEVSPSAVSIEQGDDLMVDILVSGLGNGVAPSLGVFDLDFSFDSTILNFTSAAYGTDLDVLGLGSIQITDSSISGNVNLFELSFDFPDDLDLLQPENFSLVKLIFSTANIGISNLVLSVNSFGDAFGDPVGVDLLNSAIEVAASSTGPVVDVPEPATLLLLVFGLTGMGIFRGRKLQY